MSATSAPTNDFGPSFDPKSPPPTQGMTSGGAFILLVIFGGLIAATIYFANKRRLKIKAAREDYVHMTDL